MRYEYRHLQREIMVVGELTFSLALMFMNYEVIIPLSVTVVCKVGLLVAAF